jgi:outer membrane protein OmpA-like peptidoglycan-associated protein
MKILTIILSISFLYSIPLYERFMTSRADSKFEKEFYTDAINIYLKIAQANDSNLHVITRLADSYRMVNDFQNAEKWYAHAVGFVDVDPNNYFYYAEMLKINQKYDEALDWMDKYHANRKDDIRALRHVENRNYVEMLKMDSTSIELHYLALNSSHTDFGVSFMSDKQVVFSSSRQGAKFFDRKNKRDHTPFLDMFIADIDNWELVNIQPFAAELKSPLHDGPATFSKDGNEVFFTRNVYQKRSRYEERVNRLMIYRAAFDGQNWVDIESMPFNSEEYSCGHPSLSADGQRLFFSSDMPGGYGNTDIYVAYRRSDGWSAPMNIGPNINTPGREMFPYIHADGTLYFSSDGYATLGGLDILASRSTQAGYEPPFNLGYPINSPADDFSFVLSSDGFNGYLSSNRKSSTNDDIYRFTIRPKPPIAVADYVETERYIEKVFVQPLKNDILGDGKVIELTKFSDISAMGGIVTQSLTKDELLYTPPPDFTGFDTIFYTVCDTFSFYQGCSNSYIAINVMDVYYRLIGLVVEKGTDNPIPKVEVTLLDDKSQPINFKETEDPGSFNFNLLKDKNFRVRLAKEGYNTIYLPISTIDIPKGVTEINRLIELEKLEGLTFELMILFDLGKSDIRPDAALELDEKAVTFLTENPSVVIELSAHTDSRGSAISNQRLSQRRAESAVQYLVSKGIDPSRMIAKGYGEERLLNHCKPGVRCTEEEHQRNRRVEITVLSF